MWLKCLWWWMSDIKYVRYWNKQGSSAVEFSPGADYTIPPWCVCCGKLNDLLFNISFFSLFLAPCEANTFFCHSNMCINNTLVCNGLQNCVYPWDENHCKGNVWDWNCQLIRLHEIQHIILSFLLISVRGLRRSNSGSACMKQERKWRG